MNLFVDFFSVDGHVFRGTNAKAYLLAAYFEDHDLDLIARVELMVGQLLDLEERALRLRARVDEVTTLCGPGELIDVIVTERGIAINPLRRDLREKLRGSSLPLREMADLKGEIEEICGGAPEKPELGEKVVAAIKWVDGTVIDSVREVKG